MEIVVPAHDVEVEEAEAQIPRVRLRLRQPTTTPVAATPVGVVSMLVEGLEFRCVSSDLRRVQLADLRLRAQGGDLTSDGGSSVEEVEVEAQVQAQQQQQAQQAQQQQAQLALQQALRHWRESCWGGGPTAQTDKCFDKGCDVDCKVSPWGNWTTCSAACPT